MSMDFDGYEEENEIKCPEGDRLKEVLADLGFCYSRFLLMGVPGKKCRVFITFQNPHERLRAERLLEFRKYHVNRGYNPTGSSSEIGLTFRKRNRGKKT